MGKLFFVMIGLFLLSSGLVWLPNSILTMTIHYTLGVAFLLFGIFKKELI